MILDNLLILQGAISAGGVVSGQLVTAVGTTTGTNTIDLAPDAIGGNQPGDTGSGEELNIEVSVLQTLTSGGAATVTFQLVQADDPAITTNVQVLTATAAYPFATLVAGTIVPFGWDKAAPFPPRRYIAVQVVIAGAALTNATGQFFAAITKNAQDVKNIFYRSGFAVS